MPNAIDREMLIEYIRDGGHGIQGSSRIFFFHCGYNCWEITQASTILQ